MKTLNDKKYQIKDIHPPAFSVINGQKYLFPGWIPVEDNTTFSDVEYTNPYRDLKEEVFKVKGSNGNIYTVKFKENRLKCDCPAGKFRGLCKHINQIKQQLNLSS